MKVNNMSYSISDFTKEFYKRQGDTPSYRMGQHFLNVMKINLEGTPFNKRNLWNEWNHNKAMETISNIIEYYQWDYEDLPIKDEYNTPRNAATNEVLTGKEK